jgi:flagellar biosynthesis GTPase FlhF
MYFIKTVYGNDIRRFMLAQPVFSELEFLLQTTYGKPGVSFTVRYEDEDGDVISVSSNAELEEAVKCSKSSKALTLRVAPVTDRSPSISPITSSSSQLDGDVLSIPSSVTPSADGKSQVSDGEMVSAPSSPSLTPLDSTDWNICDEEEEVPVETKTEIAPPISPISACVDSAVPPLVEESLQEKNAKILAKLHKRAIKAAKRQNEMHSKSAEQKSEKKQQKKQQQALKKSLREAKQAAKEASQQEDAVCSLLPAFPVVISQVVHRHVRCDGCQMFPLVGDRYKCETCNDFDLCSGCEARPSSHPASHPLIKFKRVEIVEHMGVKCDGCGVYPIAGDRFKCMVCPQFDLCQKCEEKRLHEVNHPLVKLRVELNTLPRALISAVRVADAAEMKAQERPGAEEAKKQSKEDSETDAEKARKRAAKKAEKKTEKEAKKEARRKEKEQKKALKKEKATKALEEVVRIVVPVSSTRVIAEEVKTLHQGQATTIPQEASPITQQELKPSVPAVTTQPEMKVCPAPVSEAKPVEVPVAIPVVSPAIPLALPVQPVSLLAPELEAKLQTLAAMGFPDRQHTCLLLARFDGNLQRTVEALLHV